MLTGYLLALASLILLGGALGDRFGRRQVFVIGTVWFAAASLLCGAAPNIDVLIVGARVCRASARRCSRPGSLAILQASFREDDRAAAVGAWSGLGGVAGAIGPFVGGWLVDGPGWRWAFLINVPVAALVVVCTRAAVPESRDPHAARGLDLVGAALAVVEPRRGDVGAHRGRAARLDRHRGGRRGRRSPRSGSPRSCWRMRHTHDPLVPPALFRSREFTVTNLATVLLYGALGVSFFLVVYELQVGVGLVGAARRAPRCCPATVADVRVLGAVGRARAADRAAAPADRRPVARRPAGCCCSPRIGPDASWLADVCPGAVVFGLGLVTFVAPLTATVMGSVDPDHVSVASGVNNAIARTASLAALAVVPVVSGLTAAAGAAQVTHAYRVSLVIAAVVAAAAAPLCFVGLASTSRAAPKRSAATYCSVDGPPLQPDPARCPPVVGRGRRSPPRARHDGAVTDDRHRIVSAAMSETDEPSSRGRCSTSRTLDELAAFGEVRDGRGAATCCTAPATRPPTSSSCSKARCEIVRLDDDGEVVVATHGAAPVPRRAEPAHRPARVPHGAHLAAGTRARRPARDVPPADEHEARLLRHDLPRARRAPRDPARGRGRGRDPHHRLALLARRDGAARVREPRRGSRTRGSISKTSTTRRCTSRASACARATCPS